MHKFATARAQDVIDVVRFYLGIDVPKSIAERWVGRFRGVMEHLLSGLCCSFREEDFYRICRRASEDWVARVKSDFVVSLTYLKGKQSNVLDACEGLLLASIVPCKPSFTLISGTFVPEALQLSDMGAVHLGRNGDQVQFGFGEFHVISAFLAVMWAGSTPLEAFPPLRCAGRAAIARMSGPDFEVAVAAGFVGASKMLNGRSIACIPLFAKVVALADFNWLKCFTLSCDTFVGEAAHAKAFGRNCTPVVGGSSSKATLKDVIRDAISHPTAFQNTGFMCGDIFSIGVDLIVTLKRSRQLAKLYGIKVEELPSAVQAFLQLKNFANELSGKSLKHAVETVSPEYVRSALSLDNAEDVWTLGFVLTTSSISKPRSKSFPATSLSDSACAAQSRGRHALTLASGCGGPLKSITLWLEPPIDQ